MMYNIMWLADHFGESNIREFVKSMSAFDIALWEAFFSVKQKMQDNAIKKERMKQEVRGRAVR